jgi:hypothetical protein
MDDNKYKAALKKLIQNKMKIYASTKPMQYLGNYPTLPNHVGHDIMKRAGSVVSASTGPDLNPVRGPSYEEDMRG